MRNRTQPRSRLRVGVVIPLLLLLVLSWLLAACSGASPGSGVASLGRSTSTTLAPQGNSGSEVLTAKQLTALTRFAACVRKHGFPSFPDPPWSNGELNSLGFTKRRISPLENGACHGAALAAGAVETPTELQERLAADLRFSECMRAHGVSNFPDPSSNGAFALPELVTGEAGYASATKACASA